MVLAINIKKVFSFCQIKVVYTVMAGISQMPPKNANYDTIWLIIITYGILQNQRWYITSKKRKPTHLLVAVFPEHYF